MYSCNNDISSSRFVSRLPHFSNLSLPSLDFPALRIFLNFRRAVHIQFSSCVHDPIFSTLLVPVSTRLLVEIQSFHSDGSQFIVCLWIFCFIVRLTSNAFLLDCFSLQLFFTAVAYNLMEQSAVCIPFVRLWVPFAWDSFIARSSSLVSLSLTSLGCLPFCFLAAAVCSGRLIRLRSLSTRTFTSWSRSSCAPNSFMFITNLS